MQLLNFSVRGFSFRLEASTGSNSKILYSVVLCSENKKNAPRVVRPPERLLYMELKFLQAAFYLLLSSALALQPLLLA